MSSRWRDCRRRSRRVPCAEGVHPGELYRWRDDGEVIQISRGCFVALRRRLRATRTCWRSRTGRDRVLRAAAVMHDLIDELSAMVQIAVPRHARPPRIAYPPTEDFPFGPETFECGLSSLEAADGKPVRPYDPARTVVDLMRLRHRLGERLAHAALRRYLRRRDAQPGYVLRLAATLDVRGPVRRTLDVATAGTCGPRDRRPQVVPTSTCRTAPVARVAARSSC